MGVVGKRYRVGSKTEETMDGLSQSQPIKKKNKRISTSG